MKSIARRFVVSIEGLSPEGIALVVTLGLVFGVFPIFWCPTIMCTGAALTLRLNFPAIQLVNQLATPLQLALLLPFTRVGGWILGRDGSWSVFTAAMDAVTGWFCLSVPLGILLYWTLLCLLRWGGRSCFKSMVEPGAIR